MALVFDDPVAFPVLPDVDIAAVDQCGLRRLTISKMPGEPNVFSRAGIPI